MCPVRSVTYVSGRSPLSLSGLCRLRELLFSQFSVHSVQLRFVRLWRDESFQQVGESPPRLVFAAPDVFRRGSSAKSDKYKDAPKMTL